MSALDSIKERLKTSISSMTTRIQETTWYANLRDRYESLNPSQQKIALFVGTLIIMIVLLFYPFTLLMKSYDHIAQYEAKRELIREMNAVS